MLHNTRHEPPFSPYLLPKPQRLGKRKVVTIAIGVLCSDGIVIGADSKESGYQTKVYRPKIFKLDIVGDDINEGLAGYGDADFLAALTENIDEQIDQASP